MLSQHASFYLLLRNKGAIASSKPSANGKKQKHFAFGPNKKILLSKCILIKCLELIFFFFLD